MEMKNPNSCLENWSIHDTESVGAEDLHSIRCLSPSHSLLLLLTPPLLHSLMFPGCLLQEINLCSGLIIKLHVFI